jgi:predicted  nucleic acid-binding Zn-ribbon protein
MAQDFSELIQYLDQKFADIEQILEKKADRDDVNNLTSSIDNVLKRLDTLNTEFLSLSNKVNRLESWIKTVADKAGVDLPN